MKRSDIEVQHNPEELRMLNSVPSNCPEFQKANLHSQSTIVDHQEVGPEYQQTVMNDRVNRNECTQTQNPSLFQLPKGGL
jgi:hypothetical protein